MDAVNSLYELSFEEVEDKIAKTRKNYFRLGISFDAEFRLAFLEQEINGNAMIRNVHKSPLQLNEKNMNQYMKYNLGDRLPFMKKRYQNKPVYLFETMSVFSDKEGMKLRSEEHTSE